jgi:hypothetical protein
MDMVERVARALASDMEEGFPRFTQQRWDEQSALAKAAHLRRARVAIEAMKLVDPQEGVSGGVAFEDAFFGHQTTIFHATRDAWNATIDAVLAPPPKPE